MGKEVTKEIFNPIWEVRVCGRFPTAPQSVRLLAEQCWCVRAVATSAWSCLFPAVPDRGCGNSTRGTGALAYLVHRETKHSDRQVLGVASVCLICPLPQNQCRKLHSEEAILHFLHFFFRVQAGFHGKARVCTQWVGPEHEFVRDRI